MRKHKKTTKNKGILVGISGAQGSFSEEAALYYARKKGISRYTPVYLISAEGVLRAVEKGEVNVGIMPIENSNGGIVIEAVYAMAQHRFSIDKLFEIDIHQNLLVYKGVTADKVKLVVSHDQAIKQCRMYLKRLWPKVKMREYPDTAQAAADLASGKLPKHAAVIASLAAARQYGLEVLAESVQDLKFNFTSFLAVSQAPER
jgi:prephenate dehydratase